VCVCVCIYIMCIYFFFLKIRQWATWHNDTWWIGQVYFSTWQTYGYVSKFHVATRINYMWPHCHVAMWQRVLIHVATWPRVIMPRVQITRGLIPSSTFLLHLATCFRRHVAIWPRGYSNCYCSLL
jgi:hypothetical protein